MVSGRFFTRDALLTTPTPAESAANARRVTELIGMDPGKIFDGFFRSPLLALDSIEPAERAKVLEQLAAYAHAAGGTSPVDSVVTVTDRRAGARDGASAAAATRSLIQNMNDASRQFWAGRPVNTAGPARSGSQADLRGINDANARFWEERGNVG